MVGNIPNFTKIDILRCFLRFGKNTGRQELARELELGEGTIRTILENLKSRKLLSSTKKGHLLSQRGSEVLNRVFESISMPKVINAQTVYPNFKKIGVQVKNVPELKEIYKLRDIAVKNGADGAIILRYQNKLYAPESDYEQDFKELEDLFDFRNNDILIVAFSDEKKNAENGALSITIELDGYLKNFINEFDKNFLKSK